MSFWQVESWSKQLANHVPKLAKFPPNLDHLCINDRPLLWAAPKMIDAEPPMSEAVAELTLLDQRPEVLAASIGVGYQWIDNPLVGASSIVRD